VLFANSIRQVSVAVVISTCAGIAFGQFKETPPPPYSDDVARKNISALIAELNAGNQQQTLTELNRLLTWFRDITDEQLIAGWKGEGRSRLPALILALADPRVADGVLDFSWRQRRDVAFRPEYAPMLGALMARYAGSGENFRQDLLSPAMQPALNPSQIETVCRILLYMPDVGNWHKDALKILPNPAYRGAALSLLRNDMYSGDADRRANATVWLATLESSKAPAPIDVDPPSPNPNRTSDSGGANTVPSENSPPVPISQVQPGYTPLAQKVHAQGVVTLAVSVDQTGTPRDIRVVGSLGYGLDQKAAEAVRQWRFQPAYRAGVKVAATARVAINFRISQAGGGPEGGVWHPGPINFDAENGVAPPVLLDGATPAPFPSRVDDTALLEFTALPDGMVNNVRYIDGPPEAQAYLTRYLSTWKFQRAIRNGAATAVEGSIRFSIAPGNAAIAPPPPPASRTLTPDTRRDSILISPPQPESGLPVTDSPGTLGSVTLRGEGGRLVPLERRQAADKKGIAGVKLPIGPGNSWVLDGEQSSVAISHGGRPMFLVRLASGVDPASVSLYPLESRKGGRRTRADARNKNVPSRIPLDVTSVGDSVYGLTPAANLEIGEYAFRSSASEDVYCFGVVPGQYSQR
jgi:TonB family protein